MYFKTHLHSQTLTLEQYFHMTLNGLFVFPPKKTLIWRRHCSIGQSCCSSMSKQSIDLFLESSSGMKFFQPTLCLTNQKPRAFVSSTSQSNRSFPFVVSVLFALSFQDHTKIAL